MGRRDVTHLRRRWVSGGRNVECRRANALGYPDGNALDVELHLAAIERIVRALDVPVSADVESGYSEDTAALTTFITRLAATGVAGYNLEDVKAEGELYALDEAVARVRAARAAAPDVFLNARTDIYLMGIGPAETRLERTLERLDAFADAGADGVFVPGVMDAETIGKLAVGSRRPLNVLAGPKTPERTVAADARRAPRQRRLGADAPHAGRAARDRARAARRGHLFLHARDERPVRRAERADAFFDELRMTS